jgi:hypothetical protein
MSLWMTESVHRHKIEGAGLGRTALLFSRHNVAVVHRVTRTRFVLFVGPDPLH